MSAGLLRRALEKAVGLAFPSPAPPERKREAVRSRPPPPVSRTGAIHVRVDPTDASVRAPLAIVMHPELGVDLVNLGLVRGWTVDGVRLHLRITATSLVSPVAPQLAELALEALSASFPDYACTVELVWEPAWTPADMTDRARAWTGHGATPTEEREMETTLDIRPIAPRDRHPRIFHTFDALARGVGFVLVNDHDPKPLYYHFQAEYGQVFGWEYLERGPETWKVRITRVA